jgi:hypothetical protein
MTHFTNKGLQAMYSECRRLGDDPQSSFYSHGSGIPNTLAGHRSAYFNGRRGDPAKHAQNTFAYAAWAAGRDDRKKDLKEGNPMPPWTMRPTPWIPK